MCFAKDPEEKGQTGLCNGEKQLNTRGGECRQGVCTGLIPMKGHPCLVQELISWQGDSKNYFICPWFSNLWPSTNIGAHMQEEIFFILFE